jgi:hypothetical protein
MCRVASGYDQVTGLTSQLHVPIDISYHLSA